MNDAHYLVNDGPADVWTFDDIHKAQKKAQELANKFNEATPVYSVRFIVEPKKD